MIESKFVGDTIKGMWFNLGNGRVEIFNDNGTSRIEKKEVKVQTSEVKPSPFRNRIKGIVTAEFSTVPQAAYWLADKWAEIEVNRPSDDALQLATEMLQRSEFDFPVEEVVAAARRIRGKSLRVKSSPFAGRKRLPFAIKSSDALIEVPDVQQPDNSTCGPACCASIGKHFGVGPDSVEEWKQLLGTTDEGGTTPEAIVNAFRRLGLRVESKQGMTLEDLQRNQRNGIVTLCPIQDYVSDPDTNWSGHWVAVMGCLDDGHVIVQDPLADETTGDVGSDAAPGHVVIEGVTFDRVWHDQDADGNLYDHFGIRVSAPIIGKMGSKGWVTIGAKEPKEGGDKHGGTHVFIDGKGKITKGPSHMVGKKPTQLKKKKPKARKVKQSPFKKVEAKKPEKAKVSEKEKPGSEPKKEEAKQPVSKPVVDDSKKEGAKKKVLKIKNDAIRSLKDASPFLRAVFIANAMQQIETTEKENGLTRTSPFDLLDEFNGKKPEKREKRTTNPEADSAKSVQSKAKANLATSPIKDVKSLNGGVNESVVVTLEDGSKGVYKNEKGETPFLRKYVNGQYYAREAAASDVADIIGLGDLVPPTVIREHEGGKGSLQKFVSGAETALDKDSDIDDDGNSPKFDGEKDRARAAAFDYLIGNTDRHHGNWLVKGNGNLVLIDHGLAFPDSHKEDNSNIDFVQAAAGKYASGFIGPVLSIPDEIKKADWSKIEQVLHRRGLTGKEIGLTKKRFDDLKACKDFKELIGKSDWQVVKES